MKSVVLNPGKDKAARNRHPWIFSGAIRKAPSAKDGELVSVFNSEGDFVAYGHFCPNSQIRVRLFGWERMPEDQIGVDYWHSRADLALRLRREWVISDQTTAFRLFHAEADQMPGVIADVYGDVVVFQLLTVGAERLYPVLKPWLEAQGWTKHYLRRPAENNVRQEGLSFAEGWLSGSGEETVEVLENGLKFKVDLANGQKTGFFLDQRESRDLLAQYSQGRKVLNTFCYTGGFSLYALRGGASEVVSVDISADAIEAVEHNVALNFEQSNHQSVVADCFEYLRSVEPGKFDLIVLDPPAFAKSAAAVQRATRGYKDINLQAFKRIAPGGLLFTYSCSHHMSADLFRKVVFGAATDAGRHVRILRQLGQPVDHPVGIYHPEGEYLKGLLLYVE